LTAWFASTFGPTHRRRPGAARCIDLSGLHHPRHDQLIMARVKKNRTQAPRSATASVI